MRGKINNLIVRYQKALAEESDEIRAEMIRRFISDLTALRK